MNFYKKAHFSKLRDHIQLTETRKVTLKGLTWVSVEICNTVLVIKMNKLPDETTLKEVTDYKETKRKEDPLPQDHSPPEGLAINSRDRFLSPCHENFTVNFCKTV